jgi:hypothetical protein
MAAVCLVVASWNCFSQVEESLMSVLPVCLAHQCQKISSQFYCRLKKSAVAMLQWSIVCRSFQAREQRSLLQRCSEQHGAPKEPSRESKLQTKATWHGIGIAE